MLDNIDLLIAGAGPVGCTIANKAANELGWRVLIVEKRNHIAGNCYDRFHESGVMVHQYGPHYFRTNNKKLLEYLSLFTTWIPGDYYVRSYYQGQLFSFPINILTLEQFYKTKLTPEEAVELLEKKRVKIEDPKNSEEFVLSKVGKELYEAFYLGYTLKHWGMHPKNLHKSVCGRIPVRYNKDQRYVDAKYQLTPEHGFTKLFQKMIHHENIHLMFNTDFLNLHKYIKPKKATVYTGPVDTYFNHKLGALPWRSLEFEFKEYKKEFVQDVVQINYPNDFDYTRSVEFKHVTKQKCYNTVVSYEYAKGAGDPYYPVPSEENHALYAKYKKLTHLETMEKKVYFAGRLANYTYLNMDQAFESALETYEIIKKECYNG